MKSLLNVTNSDAVNRYGMKFTTSGLHSALEQSWEYGIPSCLGHDRHRLIGWAFSLGMYLQPGLARLLGITMLPETEEESNLLAERANAINAKRTEDQCKDDIEDLRGQLADAPSTNARFLSVGCTACVDDGLACRRFPQLFRSCDKDGLVPLGGLDCLESGVFQIDGLLVFAHQYFRRSQSRWNTLNVPFLEKLDSVSKCGELDVRIALDRDLVGLDRRYRSPIELQYWWGPKFDDELGDIANGICRHEASQSDVLLNGISATEFWWYTQDGRKTFECEELRDVPSFGLLEGEYGCRFVHSILDSADDRPVHLDGAIRAYAGDHFLQRIDKNIHDAGRSASYTKLWRVDGKLAFADWKQLISHYYRDNRLVGEYFKGEDEATKFRPVIVNTELSPKSLEDYVPWDMKENDGVRIVVSYHGLPEITDDGRHILLLDTLTWGDRRFNVLEADTIELIKALNRNGEEISVPDNATFVLFEDMSLNFPLIVHSGNEAVQLATRTEAAIRDLCAAWTKKIADLVLTWNIGIDYSDRRVIFSYAGHVRDFQKWFDSRGGNYPLTPADCGAWIGEAYAQLNGLFPEPSRGPKLKNLIRPTGVLQLQRLFLDSSDYTLDWDKASGALVCNFAVEGNNDVLNLFQSNELAPAMAALLTKSNCTRCGRDYMLCTCSKLLDSDVSQRVNGMEIVSCFWTNRQT